MKKILGLDLGTNSIGWAVVSTNEEGKPSKIESMGSRIIPMDATIMGDFEKGNSVSQTANRTGFRGTRRLRERNLQRRERLHRVLNVLKFLPEHYANQIGFDKKDPKYLGKFFDDKELKLAWQEVLCEDKKHFEFLFMDSFNKMLADFAEHQPDLVANDKKIPIDWTIYYLRKKALTQKITKEELAWILLNFNQKRGYYQLRGEEEEENPNKLVEFHSLKVVDVKADIAYKLTLSNGMEYRYETTENLFDWIDTERNFVVTTYLNTDGSIKKEDNGSDKRSVFMLKDDDTKTIKKSKSTSVEKCSLKIVEVEKDENNKKDEVWYSLTLENGWIYRRTSEIKLDWEGKIREFIVTTDIEDDGTPKIDKEGNVKRSFRSPKEEDWTLIKKKTEGIIEDYIKTGTDKTVGTYIYDTLLQKPSQKIRGKLVRTIERKFYREELIKILSKQTEMHAELQDKSLIENCIKELYQNNENHRNNIANYSFTDLFVKDIIFYQRPLKSKKSLISDCPFESRFSEKGEKYGIKCIAKSNPLFQEFRLWKFIANLKIYEKEKNINGKLQTDVDVTAEFLRNENDYVALFEWLNDRKEVEQKIFLKYSAFELKENAEKYRWNYVEDKAYPCNDTRNLMLNKLEKASIKIDVFEKIGKKILEENLSKLQNKKPKNDDNKKELELAINQAKLECSLLEKLPNYGRRIAEEILWHILYSVEDKIEIEKALQSFAKKHTLNDEFVESFKNCKPFKKEYGSFSEKAIKKLLPLMRMGKYWSEDAIDAKTKERIENLITGEFDEKIDNRVREKAVNYTDISQFRALPEWFVCYIVYNRFSEAKDITKWEKAEDLDKYIKEFKQHSLRNPIVEQVMLETLRTVRDIWKKEGQIDEIHVELGREMKNPADKRKQMTANVTANENTNLRIKAMLMEFKSAEYQIDGVIPHSPTQQEILKIYEEFALGNLSKEDTNFEFISKMAKNSLPTKAEITKYKLWLEQKYRSPYTGEMIPLAKLFTTDYQIEHIIPQSRYFDDSFGNKVICEAEVNKLKDRQLGYEFIKNHHGEKVELSHGKVVTIFSVEEYEKFIKKYYSSTRGKMNKLLMDDIPEKFIERQLNDTRYISKEIKCLLSNIVREKLENGEYEAEATSKNVISITGAITSILKQDWGINEQWNKLVLPRFERLNELTNSNDFIAKNTQGHSIPRVPFELQKGFTTKRIDHRHHAMDAVVIACATREHVQYLNNENAKSQKFEIQRGLAKLLRRFEEVEITKKVKNENGVWVQGEEKQKIKVPKEYFKPWETFPQDVKTTLEKTLISIKQNLRVRTKTNNYYEKFFGNEKKKVKQEKGENWAIRKPMHKETVFGEVNLRKIKSVGLTEALKNPKAIVEKELKTKLIELLENGLDAKKIKKYFEENKDVWQDVNFSKIDIYYFTKNTKERFFATRKAIDISFDVKKITDSITDTGIQKILLKHLEEKENNPELAFSPEGIEEMNRNIVALNNGKNHQPIYKVRWYEKADKFAVGQKGNKSSKYVEAAKGTNLFFAVYQKETYNESDDKTEYSRNYESIPLNEVIERQKQGLKSVSETNENGDKLLFTLSPNDLVYVPTKDELQNGIDKITKDNLDKTRIYKVNDFNDGTIYFTPNTFAKAIKAKEIDTSYDLKTASLDGVQIKEICIPIKVDRLGNIETENIIL